MRFYFIFFCSLLSKVWSSNILIAFPVTGYSHFALGFRLAKELVNRGHEVTFITSFPQEIIITNLTKIYIEELQPLMAESNAGFFTYNDKGVAALTLKAYDLGRVVAETTYNNTEVQGLIHSGKKIDLFILEHFYNVALVGIGHLLNAPIIIVDALRSGNINNYITGNPAPPSYVPDQLGTLPQVMTFWQRLGNFIKISYMHILREKYHLPTQREIFKKYTKSSLELDDVLYNISLMMTNSHMSMTGAVPRVPNLVEIGGFHVEPPKKLPQELQKFLDDSVDGVVLFSMGSNIKSKDLKPETRDAILKAFAKIKQKVLWKFESDLPNIPNNVKIVKWLPQHSVLAHSNIKAFISHGGMSSSIEAVYFGVPIIGIPVFWDQTNNIVNAARKGYALKIDLNEITEEKLSWALNEVLNNPKYMENARHRSRLFHDQPVKPMDTAMYWIEHVIRYNGAPHLHNASVTLKWFQRELYDVYAFIILSLYIVIKLLSLILKRIVKLCNNCIMHNQLRELHAKQS